MGIFRQFPYTNFHEMNLNWLLSKMKELGIDEEMFKTKIEQDFAELKQDFDDFTFTVDDKVVEEVDKWLDEHPEATTTVEDGAITISKIAKSLTYSILCPSIYNFNSIGRIPYRRYTESGMQGGICTGNNVFFQYSRNDKELIKFNVETGLLINRTLINLGHCNSMAFIESENKLLCFATFGEDDLPYNRLTIINGDTLEVIDSIDLPLPENLDFGTHPVWEYGYMCAFDNDNSKLYISGQQLVRQTGDSYIIKYDYSDNNFTIENYSKININFATSAVDMCYFNGALYILTGEPSQIIIIDTEYNLVHSVPVNRTISSLAYATEFESISIVDDEIIVGFIAGCFKNRFGLGSYGYAKTPFKVSPYDAEINTPEFDNSISLYVDNSNSDYHRNGTQANPFNNIYEAINCAYNFDTVTIYDNSPNSDDFIIAVEQPQHITVNAENSSVNYGILMEGGYLFVIRPGVHEFTYRGNTYALFAENGSECSIGRWNKTGGGDNVTLSDNSLVLNNSAKLTTYNSPMVNIDCINISPTSLFNQITDYAPNASGMIRDDAPANVRTKCMKGFKGAFTGNPQNKFVPAVCNISLKVTIGGVNHYLNAPIYTAPVTFDIAGERIGLSFPRTNQWAKVELTYDNSTVTIAQLDVWI